MNTLQKFKSNRAAGKLLLITLLIIIIIIIPESSPANTLSIKTDMEKDNSTVTVNQDHLVVLWTSGDPEVAIKMVFMYTYNAKKNGWWKDVTFIIWGPSEKLASENKEIRESLVKMKEIGIEVMACRACADLYSCSPDLENLGIEVKYMGVPLTNYIKEGKNVITF